LPTNDDAPNDSETGLISRPRALALVLTIATGVVIYLCYRLASPFLPALAWALALAVIAHPLHRRIAQRVSYPNLAAGISAAVVAIIVLLPAVFVTHRLVTEGEHLAKTVQTEFKSGIWKDRLKSSPTLSQIASWLVPEMQPAAPPYEQVDGQDSAEPANPEEERPTNTVPDAAPVLNQAATAVTGGLTSFVTGTAWLCMQMFITLMALFFFLRDRHLVVRTLRSLLPLSHTEADEVFTRVDDTITATVFGSLVVAFVQGCMGGLIFWWLELPSPLLWGAVMGVLAVICERRSNSAAPVG